MAFVELALKKVAKIEKLLRQEYDANGHSIGELVRDCEQQLDSSTYSRLKKIAHQRNRLVHEGRNDAGIADEQEFLNELDFLISTLKPKNTLAESSSFKEGVGCLALFLLLFVSPYLPFWVLILAAIVALLFITK
tara:strand:- start:140 stop:544 length:405 start_codon:yes stop_codon:yes gene_type:complete